MQFQMMLHIFFFFRFLGRGLVTIPDYDTWKPRRSLYDPAFTRRYYYIAAEWWIKPLKVKVLATQFLQWYFGMAVNENLRIFVVKVCGHAWDMGSPETVLYGCTSWNCLGVLCGGKLLTGLSGHHSRRVQIFTMVGRWKWGWSICCLLTQRQCHCLVISHRESTDYLVNTLMSKTAVSLDIQCNCFPCHCICTDDLPRPMPVYISACTYSNGPLRPVTSRHLIMLTTRLSWWSDVLELNNAQPYSMLSTVLLSLIVISIVTWRA